MPLRPMTTGELLDGAVALLRTRTWRLVVLGLVLAAAEQAVLFPLRVAADQDISMYPGTGRLPEYGLLVVAGFATEVIAISTIAAVAARGAGRALLGSAASAPPPVRRSSVITVVLLVAGIVALAVSPILLVIEGLRLLAVPVTWMLVLALWALPYGLLGLAAPAAVVERRSPGSAVLRSLRLSWRDGLRAAFIRGVGYVSWMFIRYGMILAINTLIVVVWGSLPSSTWDRVALAAMGLVVNTVAYAVLGCLDVMLLLETRMRTEGLDIGLRWALRRGVSPTLDAPARTAPTLEAPR